MSKTISLTFGDLSAAQATALLEFYSTMVQPDTGDTVSTRIATMPAPTPGVPAVIGAAVHDALAYKAVMPPPPPPPAARSGALAAGTLDQKGVPYNPEFHAPSGRQSVSGEWTLKKGVDKAGAEKWVKAHKGKGAAPSVVAAPAPAVTAPPPPPLDMTTRQVTYAEFGELYNRLANSGKINGEHVNQVMAQTGVTDPSSYVTDADKRQTAYMLFQKFDV